MPFGNAAAADRRGTAAVQWPPVFEPQARTCLLLLAVIAALWMATRPYRGVIHDTRLYTVQAIGGAHPDRFATDLYLQFGSQDRFTVFSYLYEPVLRWVGVSWGALLLTLLAHAAWLGGAYVLAKALLRDPVRALAAVAGLVALPSVYGAQFSFSYGEQFLTPRLFAEAVTMAALGCALRGFPGPAAAALAAAAAFHPVMAVSGASALLLYKAPGNRAWWIGAACAAAAAAGLAASGVEPFARLGARMDPDWYEIVRQRTAYAFIGEWSAVDWSILAGHAALGTLALVTSGPAERRFFLAVLLTAILGLAVSFFGAEPARDQFLMAMQTWRASWLLGVTAHLMAVPLLLRFHDRAAAARQPAEVFLFAGVALLVAARLVPASHVWAAASLAAAAAFAVRRADDGPVAPVVRVFGVAAAAVVAASIVSLAFAAKDDLQPWPERHWPLLWAFGLCVGGLALAAAAALRRAGPPSASPALNPVPAVCAAYLVLCAALGWDQRTAWTTFVESSDPTPDDLAGFLPGDAVVYWEGGLELLWLRLRKPSYHSCAQAAGVVFFRGTAMAYRQRSESLPFENGKFERCRKPGADHGARATRDDLRRACAREPGLGHIVLSRPVEGGVPRREWVPPVKVQDVRIADGGLHVREVARFYAYACDDLR